jgi:hypothetical protein
MIRDFGREELVYLPSHGPAQPRKAFVRHFRPQKRWRRISTRIASPTPLLLLRQIF